MIRRDVKINPFEEGIKRPGKISYGVTSYGLDVRIGYKFQVFSNVWCGVVDPKAWDSKAFVDIDLTPPGSVDHILIPPNSFALGETVEELTIPRDCLAICVGKSTMARCGIIVNVTPLEPEWTGKVTVEISNTTPLPAKIYAGEGIMQVIFLRTDGHGEAVLNAVRRLCGDGTQEIINRNPSDPVAQLRNINGIEELLHRELGNGSCKTSYADKKGKYQDQSGLTPPKVDNKGD